MITSHVMKMSLLVKGKSKHTRPTPEASLLTATKTCPQTLTFTFPLCLLHSKKFFNHAGNSKLRDIVASLLSEYKRAATKTQKSEVISVAIAKVQDDGGHFVKRNPACPTAWMFADDRLCREKCSQTFRDSLHEIYRSSSVAKKNKRRLEQQQEEEGEQQPESSLGNMDADFAQVSKRRRLEEDSAQLAPVSWDNIPAFDRLTASVLKEAPKKTENNNLVSILSELVNIPLLDEDDCNPFEPTPLSSNDFFDMSTSSMIETRPVYSDDSLGGGMLYTQSSDKSSAQPSRTCDYFPSFTMDSSMDAFEEDDLLIVSPMFKAAFAA